MKKFTTFLTLALLVATLALVPLSHAGDGPADGSSLVMTSYPPQLHAASGGTVAIHVTGLPDVGAAYLVIGFSQLNQPFGDYVLVPNPDYWEAWCGGCLVIGELDASIFVPAHTLPAGTTLWYQVWQDANADGPGSPVWVGSNAKTLDIVP